MSLSNDIWKQRKTDRISLKESIDSFSCMFYCFNLLWRCVRHISAVYRGMLYNFIMDLHDKKYKLTKSRIEALHKLGIDDSDTLLAYYPSRYEIISVRPVSDWKIKEKVTFEAVVVSPVSSWRKGKVTISNFEVMVEDALLKVTIFNRPWVRSLRPEQVVTITGIYNGGSKLTAVNYDEKPLHDHNAVTPIYCVKGGVKQQTIRKSMRDVYDAEVNEMHDIIPEDLIRKYRLLRRYAALGKIHFPHSEEDIKQARRTLKYEEFLCFFLTSMLLKRENGMAEYKTPKVFAQDVLQRTVQMLPFALTKDQNTVLEDILNDMGSSRRMYRLVQGDVGCGKTAVAALAMYACVLSGYQAALLAPTEILVRQHAASFGELLQGTGLTIVALYSGMDAVEKAKMMHMIADGTADIVIGTHAILQEAVVFYKLGLAVADEQQRFGVSQRKALLQKGDMCDFLLMSATPIPRTLASAVFGDLDVSTIETLPTGRQTPKTVYVRENSFRSVLQDVKDLLEAGRQLYVICAAVDKSDDYKARNVFETAENLQKLFTGYRVGILHGRMSSQQKQDAMYDFANKKYDILVSTTVVEVGMNVVNATGMIIYDADRFGLSQLHQLRGRIQRGSERGCCWLLSNAREPQTVERLEVLVKTNNGFEISREDLRLRGPGDILGTRQSGVPDLVLGNLVEDTAIIDTAKKDASVIAQHPDDPTYETLIGYCEQRINAYTD